jgi:hypothetical protein
MPHFRKVPCKSSRCVHQKRDGVALLNLRSFWKIQSFWRKVARNVKFILKLMGK